MLSFSRQQRYYFYPHVCDMRKQFDGLAGLVRDHFENDLFSGDVFIFLNRRRDRLKLLMWDESGFVMYYKRLEKGTFEMPDAVKLDSTWTWSDLIMLLEGIELKSIKKRKKYQRSA